MAFFVNVPNVPGVPAVLRPPGFTSIVSLITRDVLALFGGASANQRWGIYQGGAPVVLADNCVAVEYRQQWQIADYLVERGAFESYDKVATPFDTRVRMSAGGSQSDREAFLGSIDAIAGTLELFDVVTPEAVYTSCNISRYDLHRTATNGVGLLTVDIALQEIRVTATAMMSNTQSPTSAGQVNGGAVQTTSATSKQEASVPPRPFNDGNKE
ncbi:hypothetical protein BFS86_19390 [Shewanella algae]|jgi:hypothetical protein|nr:hypothetical protein BFS86_19390 [Shewanella algae]DAQ47183.1 MAG TPA: hypothetical protein [Caudoviricetes sp.]DAU40305.1 MAG TPA: hypothetical protein [Caudoviricetes sp.]